MSCFYQMLNNATDAIPTLFDFQGDYIMDSIPFIYTYTSDIEAPTSQVETLVERYEIEEVDMELGCTDFDAKNDYPRSECRDIPTFGNHEYLAARFESYFIPCSKTHVVFNSNILVLGPERPAILEQYCLEYAQLNEHRLAWINAREEVQEPSVYFNITGTLSSDTYAIFGGNISVLGAKKPERLGEICHDYAQRNLARLDWINGRGPYPFTQADYLSSPATNEQLITPNMPTPAMLGPAPPSVSITAPTPEIAHPQISNTNTIAYETTATPQPVFDGEPNALRLQMINENTIKYNYETVAPPKPISTYENNFTPHPTNKRELPVDPPTQPLPTQIPIYNDLEGRIPARSTKKVPPPIGDVWRDMPFEEMQIDYKAFYDVYENRRQYLVTDEEYEDYRNAADSLNDRIRKYESEMFKKKKEAQARGKPSIVEVAKRAAARSARRAR